jgi:hypothetical protein
MFGLFGSNNDEQPRKKRRGSGVLQLPGANTGSSDTSEMNRLRMRQR